MAKRIWKFPLTTNGVIKRINGKLSRLLAIDVQNGEPYCWILMDDEVEEVSIDIVAIGTGWELPEEVEKMGFVGTLQVGEYVWHYFWRLVDSEI